VVIRATSVGSETILCSLLLHARREQRIFYSDCYFV
jgi:hypothetical protein